MELANLGDIIIFLAKEIKSRTEKKLKEIDIGIGQLQVLMMLFYPSESVVTQKVLVEKLGVDKGNVSRNVNNLLNKGYIKINDDPNSNKQLKITESGMNLKTLIIPVLLDTNQELLKNITEEELHVTIKTLTQMMKNMEE